MTVFVHGKQKRVKRPPMIEGIPAEEFIRRNADELWYHQNETWDAIEFEQVRGNDDVTSPNKAMQTADATRRR